MSGRDMYMVVSNEEHLARYGFEVKLGGMLYIGSYKISGIKNSLLGSGSFNIEITGDNPGPRKILEHLKIATKGTGWDQPIQKFLDNLR